MPRRIGGLTLYTLEEIGEEIGVTVRTIREYIKQDKLQGRKFGGRWFVTEEHLREYFGVPASESKKEKEGP